METSTQAPESKGGTDGPGNSRSSSFLIIVVCLVGFPAVWLFWLGAYAFMPGPVPSLYSDNTQVEVIIPGRAGLESIKDILAAGGVIRDDPRFTVLASLTGLARRLQAGEYRLQTGLSPYKVLAVLKDGKVLYRPITIPEGTDIYRMADILATGGWVDRDRFIQLVSDPAFIKEFDLKVNSLEGYLFPDTYYLSHGQQDEQAIIRMMAARSAGVFNEIMEDSGRETNLSRHQVLTIASIVEKETASAEERPLIAGVFLNRYKKGMRLQADPTVIYGIADFDGNLTRQDLETPSPYNTYVIDGLPPGPISNPGRAAIEAVLAPAAGSYLYFVSKNDGTHHFSKTLEEHNRAVREFQKNKKRITGN